MGTCLADEFLDRTTVKGTVKGTAKGNRENAFTSKCQDKKTPNGGGKHAKLKWYLTPGKQLYFSL